MSPNFEGHDPERFSNPLSSHTLEQMVVVRKHRSRVRDGYGAGVTGRHFN
jgi:hypothetical protein